MCLFDQNSVVQPKLSSHWRNALCTNWWAPACTNCQLIVASGEGGQLKSLRNHAWSQMLTPTVDFLLHLLCQLPFQSFNCMYTAQGMNSNLDLVSLLAPPLSAGSRCYRARQSDEANRCPMDAIFTGPRCLWGPVCGSRCLSLTSSDTFGWDFADDDTN